MRVVRSVLAVIGLVTLVIAGQLTIQLARFARRRARCLGQQRRERDRYPAWAAAHRLTYAERGDEWLEQLVKSDRAPLAEFRRVDCWIGHLFRGDTDTTSPMFFQLSFGLPSSARWTLRYTVAVTRVAVPVSDLVIRPRTRRERRKPTTAPTGDEAFDRAYVVRSDAPETAGPLLGDELAERLVALPEQDRPIVRVRDGWLVVQLDGPLTFDRGKRLSELASATSSVR